MHFHISKVKKKSRMFIRCKNNNCSILKILKPQAPFFVVLSLVGPASVIKFLQRNLHLNKLNNTFLYPFNNLYQLYHFHKGNWKFVDGVRHHDNSLLSTSHTTKCEHLKVRKLANKPVFQQYCHDNHCLIEQTKLS